MNQSGQMFSVFKLAIFAVITVLIIYLISTFFVEDKKSAIEELKESMDLAQANEGARISKIILLEKDFALNAEKIFDSQIRSVSFKCNSSYCAQKVLQVSPRNLVNKEKISIMYTARCIFEKGLYNCKIYFGTPPAQIKISGEEMKGEFDLESEKVKLAFFVENTGEQSAVNVEAEVKVYKNTVEEGRPVETLYTEPLTVTIALLEVTESKKISFNLPIKNSGDYTVKVRVFGIDAGEAKKEHRFVAKGVLVSSNCFAGEKLETYLNETLNKCITRYSCTDCVMAFECAQKWQEMYPEIVFESSSKELTIESIDPINGLCE